MYFATLLAATCSVVCYARPVLNLTSPVNGQTIGSPVMVAASLSDNASANYSVYVNGTLKYQTTAAALSTSVALQAGSYTFHVSATYRGITYSKSANVTVTESGGSSGLAQQINSDMTGLNEANPQNVPSYYDWYSRPVMVDGNTPPAGYAAMTAWGMVTVPTTGNPSTNTLVNIRNMQTWVLSKSSGVWSQVQLTSQPNGGMYIDDFSFDDNFPADTIIEQDGTLAVANVGGGYTYHFYPLERASMNPNDIGGVVVLFEARLIVADSSKPDDRGIAQYIANAGGDFWQSLTSGGTTGPIADGKLKFVKPDWRSFAITTMTLSQLTANPPPIDLSGMLP